MKKYYSLKPPITQFRREFISGLGLVLVGCSTGGVDISTPVPDLDRSGGESQDYNADGLARSNKYRQEAGLRELVASDACTKAAMEHALNMAITDTMAHSVSGVGPNGDVATRLRNFKVPLPHAENVSYGYRNVMRAVDAWYQSPGHNKNLMNSAYRRAGVAGARHPNSNHKIYWCSVYSA